MGEIVADVERDRTPSQPARGRDDGLSIELLLLLAAFALVMVGQGGYYGRVSAVSGGLVVAAAAIAVSRRRQSILHSTRWALAGLAFMAVCVVAAGALDGFSSRIRAPMALLLVLAAVVLIVGSSSARLRCQFGDVVVVLGAFLAVTAWIGVAFHLRPLGHPDGGLWRAATTVTYANAAAAVLAPVSLWSIGRRTTSDGRARRGASVLVLLGLIATLSRAGLGSFVVGLVALAMLLGSARVWHTAAPTLVGALIAAAALVPGIEASGPARPLWAILGLIAGLSIGLVLQPRAVPLPGRRGNSSRRLRLALLGLVAAGAAGMFVAVDHSGPWSNRLSLASADRGSLASVALHQWRTHLVAGVGPDREMFIWTTSAGREVFDRYAHDEYLQLAAEQGAIGLLGLAALATGVATTVRRRWRSRTLADTDLTALQAGAIAGLVCFTLQSGFDFLWHVPVVPMIAAAGVGLAAGLPSRDVMSQPTQQQEVPCSVENG